MPSIAKELLESLVPAPYLVIVIGTLLAILLVVEFVLNPDLWGRLRKAWKPLGIIAICAAASVCLTWYFRGVFMRSPAARTVIVVPKFPGDTGAVQRDIVNSLLIESLKLQITNLTVLAVDDVLDGAPDFGEAADEKARSIGRKYRASLVLWGGGIGSSGKLWGRITITDATEFFMNNYQLGPQAVNVIPLPDILIHKPIRLALIASGLAAIGQGHCDLALSKFQQATNEQGLESNELAACAFYAATCHLRLAELTNKPEDEVIYAADDFHLAAKLFGVAKMTEGEVTAANNEAYALWLEINHAKPEKIPTLLSNAVDVYKDAEGKVDRVKSIRTYGVILGNKGAALRDLSLFSGTNCPVILADAIRTYTNALAILDDGSNPAECAAIRNNLAVAMQDLADYSLGTNVALCLAESTKSIDLALRERNSGKELAEKACSSATMAANRYKVAAHLGESEAWSELALARADCREALRFYGPGRMPDQWIITLSLSADISIAQALRRPPTERLSLLNEAVTNYAKILAFTESEKSKLQHAYALNNFATALRYLSISSPSDAVALLKASAKNFEAAVSIYDVKGLVLQSVRVKDNLGVVWSDLAKLSSGSAKVAYLTNAIATHEDVLRFVSKDNFAQDWAYVECNYGSDLCAMASLMNGKQAKSFRDRGIIAYQRALTVFDPRHFPYEFDIVIKKLHHEQSAPNI